MGIANRENNPRKNSEGYSDPTAFEALRNIDKEDERFHRLLHTLFYICELADFQIEGRIVLIDKQTGRVWRTKSGKKKSGTFCENGTFLAFFGHFWPICANWVLKNH